MPHPMGGGPGGPHGPMHGGRGMHHMPPPPRHHSGAGWFALGAMMGARHERPPRPPRGGCGCFTSMLGAFLLISVLGALCGAFR